MTELLTSAQMRATEDAAIASGQATGQGLMERAGQAVVDAVLALCPGPGRALVLCGPGNNDGDGFVIARLLHAWGWTIDCRFAGKADGLPPDARANHDRWVQIGPVLPVDAPPEIPDVVIDALFGTGLSRPLPDDLRQRLLELARDCARAAWVAVDVPSGMNADSGLWTGGGGWPCAYALTVTFHRPRPCHYLWEYDLMGGRLVVADIGLEGVATGRALRLGAVDPAVIRKTGGHKYDHGHALVIAGGAGRGGAARLAARGALRIGAGLVTLACPEEAMAENASRLDAIMLRQANDAAALDEILHDQRLNALCLGPGLGVDRARALVPVAAGARRGLVLDADAITAFAEAPDRLFELLHPQVVLTPHEGEFARIFPDLSLRDGPRPEVVRQAAARAGAVVLLKGPTTIIAAPDGVAVLCHALYDRRAPWLATAGAGDVLAGFITGLMARGIAPLKAAEQAALLHVDCARAFGPGLIAEDLPETLPVVLRKLD